MLQVSYSERLLGDNPSFFLKAKLVYLHYTPGRFSPTPLCKSGDRHKQAKGCRGTVVYDTQ